MNKRAIDTYFCGNVLPRWVIFLIDTFIVVLSFLFPYFVLLSSRLPEDPSPAAWLISRLSLVLGINIISFLLFKTFAAILRYFSFIDIVRLFNAQTLAFVCLFIINEVIFLVSDDYWIPTGVLPITYVLSLVMLISLRIVVKIYFENRNFEQRDVMRVMIYAGKEKCADIARRLHGDDQLRYRIRGFIVDEPEIVGRRLMAMPVFANNSYLLEVIDHQKIDVVIVDPDKVEIIRKTGLSDKLLKRGINLKVMRTTMELNRKDIMETTPLTEIKIEDLLVREAVKVNEDEIQAFFAGKRILITGAAGSVGGKLVPMLADCRPEELILVDQAETPMHDVRVMLKESYGNVKAHTIVADITNKSRIEKLFEEYNPEIVFHMAAYKHIPLMESNVTEAIQDNILGTVNVADLSVKYKVKHFIFFSASIVVNPVNIIGMTKRLAEDYVQALAAYAAECGTMAPKFVTVRFGNILDSDGSVLSLFKSQIADGGPVTVTHPDAYRFFISARETCALVLEACLLSKGGEIYNFDMGEPVKIQDLAKRLIRLLGYPYTKEIRIEFIGLRSGEKLNEEKPAMPVVSTRHPRIMQCPVLQQNYHELNVAIRKLIMDSYGDDDAQMLESMKTLLKIKLY